LIEYSTQIGIIYEKNLGKMALEVEILFQEKYTVSEEND